MQVTQTIADGLKHEFMIVVAADEIESKIEDRLKELSVQIRLPGFRPGKAPMALVRRRYEQSVVGEVLDQSVQESVRKTLDERKLRPAMQPKVEVASFENGKPFEFKVAFEALPEIGEIDFSSIEIVRRKVSIAEGDVDEALRRLAEGRKTAVIVDAKRKAGLGDVLQIGFVGRVDGVEFEGGTGETDLELGSKSFIPGFEDQLVGAEVGDARTVRVTFPEAYHVRELAGKEAEFDVNVKALKEWSVPAIGEDFAKEAGLESLEALRQAVKEQLERQYERIVRGQMKRVLLEKLDAAATFPLPEGMVAFEFEGIWKQVEEAKAQGRLDEEDKNKSGEELRDEYRAIAERRVRLGLLLADVGRRHGVQIAQEELERAMIQEVRRYPGYEREAFNHFRNNPEALERLRAPLYEDKVVDFILELARTPEEEASIAELDAAEAQGEAAEKPKRKASGKKAQTSGDASA